MGKKNKNNKQRERRRQSKPAPKREQKSAAPKPSAPNRADLGSSIDPPMPERLRPEIYLDQMGRVVPDPFVVLGLAPGTLDEESIRTAFRTKTIAHPPEIEPERALQIREARDRLLDPARLLERELLVLRPPDPAAWPLGADVSEKIDAQARLVGQVALYALLEDALWAEVSAAVTAEEQQGKGKGRSKR